MDNSDFSLTIRMPVHKLSSKTDEPSPIPGGNITQDVMDTWQRGKNWMLGDDTGRFTLYGTISEMIKYFSTWLTYDVVEQSGGLITWNGRIRKMVLSYGALPIQVDLGEVYNRVQGYVGDLSTFTSIAENSYSIDVYGRRTMRLVSGINTLAEAEDARDTFLARHAWPTNVPTGGGATSLDYAKLDVYVEGYGASLDDRFVREYLITPANGVSAALSVIMNDAYYVTERSIATNTTTIYDDFEFTKAGVFVKNLLAMTDSSNNLYRGWINGNRYFYYKAIDNTPDYFIRNGRVYTSSGAETVLSAYQLEPGIYRNYDIPLSGRNRDSFFADMRDIWIDGIWIHGDGEIRWKPETTPVSEFLVAFKDPSLPAASTSAAISNKKKKRSKWRWKYMSDAQRAWWIGGRVGPAPD